MFDKNSAFNPREELAFDPYSPPPATVAATGGSDPEVPEDTLERWYEVINTTLERMSNLRYADSMTEPDLEAVRDEIYSYLRG